MPEEEEEEEVNDSPVLIYLNWFLVMDKFNHIGPPSKISIELQIKSYVVSWKRGDEDP